MLGTVVWRVPTVIGVLTVGNTFTSHYLWTTHGWTQKGWAVALLVTMGGPVVVATISKRRREDADVTKAVGLNSIVSVLASALGECVTEHDPAGRAARVVKLRQEAVDSVAAVSPNRRIRATYFSAEVVDGRKCLVPREHFGPGRDDEPTTTYFEDNPRGRPMFGLIASGEGELWEDLDQLGPDGWVEHGQVYKSLLQAPVRIGTDAFGLLSVDAPKAGELTSEDLGVARTLAKFIATAMATLEGHDGDVEGTADDA